MRYRLLTFLFLPAGIMFATYTNAQERIYGATGDKDPLYNKLYAGFASVKYNNKKVPVVRLPKRKFDSPFFANDLIPYRKGYIINSLTTSPGGGGRIDIAYRFYYFDHSEGKLTRIRLNELDSIHSMITVEDTLYVSGKKGNNLTVYYYIGKVVKELPFGQEWRDALHLDDNWVKLGLYGTEIIALLQNAVLVYRDGRWQKLIENSLEEYKKQKGSKRKGWLIPTENIRVHNNKLYFLSEITQQRTSYLYEMDLTKPQSIQEFFEKHELIDNTQKEIDGYMLGSDNQLYVVIRRLMEKGIILQVNEDKVSTIVLHGFLESVANGSTLINATSMTEEHGSKILFAVNGVFEWKDDTITPLIMLDKTTQELKVEGAPYDFEFHPRSVYRLGSYKFLIGGLWGGLYILDISSRKMTCLDNSMEELGEVNLFGNE